VGALAALFLVTATAASAVNKAPTIVTLTTVSRVLSVRLTTPVELPPLEIQVATAPDTITGSSDPAEDDVLQLAGSFFPENIVERGFIFAPLTDVVEAGQARRVYDWVGSAQLPAGTYYVHAAVDDAVAVNATWAKLCPVLGTFPCPVWARYPRWSDAWGITIAAPAPAAPPPPVVVTGTTPAPDTSPPIVVALPSRGRPGHEMVLRFRIADDSGRTRDVITLTRRNGRVVDVLETPLGWVGRRLRLRGWVWDVPKSFRGRGRFCVRAFDKAGNGSRSCAPFVVQP
jgi:hypothetical protein